MLRDRIGARIDALPPPPDVYATVRRRHRRRRTAQVVATAVAAAVVVTGVPLTLNGLRGPASPTAASPTAAGPSDGGPGNAGQPIRGSLAGDRTLIDEAVRLLLKHGPVDRSTVQVSYAEESVGYRIVVLAAVRPTGGEGISMVAGAAPGAALEWVAGGTGTRQPQDAGLGQQYFAPQHVLTRFTIGDRSFGLALFPDGYRATIQRGTEVAADCTLDTAPATALPVPSFFPITGADAPSVSIYAAGGTKPALTQALAPTGNGAALPELPTRAEIAAQIRASMRGKKDTADELATYPEIWVRGTGVGTLPDRFLGVWAGDLPVGRGYAALWGGVYPSGATILEGVSSNQDAKGLDGWFSGCLPAGTLDHTVIAVRLSTALTKIPGNVLVIFAPAGAKTAEVSFGSGAPVTVPLSQGGGFLQHAGKGGQVRALDAAGQVIATSVVDQRPIGLPLMPR
jgi:hypothetical protein